MKTPDFTLLKTLVAVAESKNFAEAGSRLGLSQPAVTQQLQRLGAEVPFPLFQTEGKRKTLTFFAKELYQIAKKQQHSLQDDYEALNRKFAGAEHLTLRVGGRREILETLVDKFLFEGKTEFRYLSNDEAITKLQSHDIDVAIAYRLPDSLHLTAKKLLSSGARLAVHKSLLKKFGGSANSLLTHKTFFKSAPCVAYHTDGHLLKEFLEHHGVSMNEAHVRATVEDWRALMSLIEKGYGFGILPDYIDSKVADVITLDVPEKILKHFQFYAVFQKDLKKISGFDSVQALRS